MSIRVLIVDDQAMVRIGLAALLSADPGIEVVGEAADGSGAVARTRELRPDVVLMDVRMPVMDGIAATREILDPSAEPVTRVLMLTTFDIDEYVFDAIRAGASGFLLKDAPPDELVRAVRIVHGGDALLSPVVTKRMIEHFVSAAPSTAKPIELDRLTDREREVLQLVASGLTNREIAAELVVVEQTVKSHVSRILTKLALRDRAQAVIVAYESGLIVARRRT